MYKKILFFIVIICCLAGGGFWYYTKYKVGNKQIPIPFFDQQPVLNETTSTPIQVLQEGQSATSSDVVAATSDMSNLIHVTTVSSSQEVVTPLTIEGDAVANWYDDEKFPVQIINEQGKILGSSVAQAKEQDTPGEFIPFIVTVDFDAGFYSTGYVVLQNASDKSVSLKMPVQFSQKTNERVSGGCKVTGCSSQVCADQDVVTDCSYKEEYMCYQKARCERQADGNCGWTQSKELRLCLDQFDEEQNTP